MCTHADCYALFISLEDSEEHAISTHGGNVAAITCGVYECRDESEATQLYRVLDKDGEHSNKYLRAENSTQGIRRDRTTAIATELKVELGEY